MHLVRVHIQICMYEHPARCIDTSMAILTAPSAHCPLPPEGLAHINTSHHLLLPSIPVSNSLDTHSTTHYGGLRAGSRVGNQKPRIGKAPSLARGSVLYIVFGAVTWDCGLMTSTVGTQQRQLPRVTASPHLASRHWSRAAGPPTRPAHPRDPWPCS